WVVAGSGLPGVHAPPGGDPHADEEAPRCGADPGATMGQPGAPPAAAADRACQQPRQALSHGERPDPPVEGGRPRSRDGTVRGPPQLPGAPAPLVTHDLIGINSTTLVTGCQGAHRVKSSTSMRAALIDASWSSESCPSAGAWQRVALTVRICVIRAQHSTG